MTHRHEPGGIHDEQIHITEQPVPECPFRLDARAGQLKRGRAGGVRHRWRVAARHLRAGSAGPDDKPGRINNVDVAYDFLLPGYGQVDIAVVSDRGFDQVPTYVIAPDDPNGPLIDVSAGEFAVGLLCQPGRGERGIDRLRADNVVAVWQYRCIRHAERRAEGVRNPLRWDPGYDGEWLIIDVEGLAIHDGGYGAAN